MCLNHKSVTLICIVFSMCWYTHIKTILIFIIIISNIMIIYTLLFICSKMLAYYNNITELYFKGITVVFTLVKGTFFP